MCDYDQTFAITIIHVQLWSYVCDYDHMSAITIICLRLRSYVCDYDHTLCKCLPGQSHPANTEERDRHTVTRGLKDWLHPQDTRRWTQQGKEERSCLQDRPCLSLDLVRQNQQTVQSVSKQADNQFLVNNGDKQEMPRVRKHEVYKTSTHISAYIYLFI